MKTIRENTQKDYAKRMDRVLEHIQHHLDDDLALDQLADIACFSRFHFHRIFTGMVGESVKSYIRRLRLERAAGRLKLTEYGVTRIAFEAGFGTHESFTRAFHKMFGVSPLSFRKAHTFHCERKSIDYWREIKMKVEMVDLDEMTVIYVRHKGPYDKCGAAWDALCQWAAPKGLLQPGAKMLGLSYDDPHVTPPDKLRYDACLEVAEKITVEPPVGLKKLDSGRYAMTTHFGPYDGLADTYAQFCGQWLPQHGYEIATKPCLEIYRNSPEDTDPEDLITDIFIPLG